MSADVTCPVFSDLLCPCSTNFVFHLTHRRPSPSDREFCQAMITCVSQRRCGVGSGGRGQAVALSLIPFGATKMTELPPYEIKVFAHNDLLPVEAEEMFARQLADSRKALPPDRADRHQWQFALTCAVTPDGHVLGGVHLDIGPICGAASTRWRSFPTRPERTHP